MRLSYLTYRDALTAMGDPRADAAVAGLVDSGLIAPGTVDRLFAPAGAPPEVRAFLEDTPRLPPWVRPERLGRIASFFRRHRTAVTAVQATAGLVGAYLSPPGARALDAAHELGRPHQRLTRATRLFTGMAAPDAFAGARIVPVCRRIRLVHAAIRQLLPGTGRWHGDDPPLSQLGTAGAVLTCSVGALDALDRLGVPTTPEDREDNHYAWRIVAHFLGVPDEYLPDSAAEARELWHEVRAHEWAHSEAGVRLAQATIGHYQEHVPPDLRAAVPAFVRRALADEHADLVEVPRGAFDGRVVGALCAAVDRTAAAVDRTAAAVPGPRAERSAEEITT